MSGTGYVAVSDYGRYAGKAKPKRKVTGVQRTNRVRMSPIQRALLDKDAASLKSVRPILKGLADALLADSTFKVGLDGEGRIIIARAVPLAPRYAPVERKARAIARKAEKSAHAEHEAREAYRIRQQLAAAGLLGFAD